MNTIEVLNAINAALALSNALLPSLQAAVSSGDVTPEQQAEVLAKFEALRDNAAAKFSGPEWQLSGR